MKLFNLQLQKNIKIGAGNYTRLVCNVTTSFSDVEELYFYVDNEYADWLTPDVYDAFLVASIYPAMFYNESIEIEGNVSKKLYHNITNYVQAIVRDFAPATHKPVEIQVNGFADAAKNDILHIGTGFSGGIDSFSTMMDRFVSTDDPDYKVDTLFFFHLGQYGNVDDPISWERANNRFQITKDFANKIGVKAVMLNTNLFDLYKPDWEYRAGVLNRIAAVLIFQRALKRYYISNAYTYGEMLDLAHDRVLLEEFSDPYIMPLLSPIGLDIICDGCQYRRTGKTERIKDYSLAHQYLNVCINSTNGKVDAINCSECPKCMRTMMALDSIGVLEKFSAVFDIKKYHKHVFGYKCRQIWLYKTDGFARDNVDFAREHNKSVPSKPIAYIYVFMSRSIGFAKRIMLKFLKK